MKNLCNCPNCQTENCPQGKVEQELFAMKEKVRGLVEIWENRCEVLDNEVWAQRKLGNQECLNELEQTLNLS